LLNIDSIDAARGQHRDRRAQNQELNNFHESG
jgi:hypothetical protein